MLSVIIVDYKTLEKTIRYINHLKQYLVSKSDIHYIIVDNTSDPKGAELFTTSFSNVKKMHLEGHTVLVSDDNCAYCLTGSNMGYAKGNNLGALISTTLYKDSLLLFSNNDIRLINSIDVDDVLQKMEGEIVVIGPKVVGLDGEKQSPYKEPSFWESMVIAYLWPLNHVLKKPEIIEDDKSRIAYRVIGCFMFVLADAFRRVGGFDKNTFLYFEEAILSEKMHGVGFKTYYYNEIEIIHEHEGTTKKTAKREDVIKWYYESAYYYFKTYRGASDLSLLISKEVFSCYIRLRRLMCKLAGR